VWRNLPRQQPTAILLVHRHNQIGQPQADTLLRAKEYAEYSPALRTEFARVQLGRQITCVIDQGNSRHMWDQGRKDQCLRHAVDLDRGVAALDLGARQCDERAQEETSVGEEVCSQAAPAVLQSADPSDAHA